VAPDPSRGKPDEYLVESILVGLCGTDNELIHRDPVESSALTIGHESLGRVLEGPSTGALVPGDLVVGIIRSPCSALCEGCRLGRLDLCRSRPLVERGIYGCDGFGSDRWLATAGSLVQIQTELAELGIFTEPLSSIMKGARRLTTVQQAIPTSQQRALLIAGAGPMGLLAAWSIGRDFEDVYIVDPSGGTSAREATDRLSNVTMMTSWERAPMGVDVFIDCSGQIDAIRSGLERLVHAGIALIIGICGTTNDSLPSRSLGRLVLDDITLLGTVNASREDHEHAARMLLEAPPLFLRSLITDEISPEEWPAWIARTHLGEIKSIIRFSS
jgi:glucose 1-dehydrogenase